MHNDRLITIKGARTHNLKNIDLVLPRDVMIVFTGLSGSGKSSLAFDTIFAEGQRRYVESLSAYARQFLHQMQKPDVDEITGLSPAISIDQKSRSSNPRSTVATITEIYDYLRVLYARIGIPHCLTCGRPIEKLSSDEIVGLVLAKIRAARKTERRTVSAQILAPIVRGRKGEYYQLLYDLLGKGYTHVRIDGAIHNLRERIELAKHKKHSIDIVVDTIEFSGDKRDEKLVRERVAEAVEKALHDADGVVRVVLSSGTELILSAKFSCPADGFSYPEVEPRLFSFNSPYGACPLCHGLGTKHLFGDEPCESCHGARLRPEALHVRIGGKNIHELVASSIQDASRFFKELELNERERGIAEAVTKEIEHRLSFMLDVGIEYLSLNRRADTLSGGEAQRIRLASQLGSRLVGALYVLDEPTIGLHQRDNERLIKTLQNLRDLGNTIIVVEHDEDTIFSSDYLVDIGPGAGVHGGEIVAQGYLEKLLDDRKAKSMTLEYLRGERKVAIPAERRQNAKGELKIRGGSVFNIKRMDIDIPLGRFIAITGVSGSGKSSLLYELLYKNLQARFDRRYRSARVLNATVFLGTEYLNRAVLIDQSAIGRTPRSNPATYTGTFTFIRELFAETEEARIRGWSPSRFSFNVRGLPAPGSSRQAGGRCEACEGNGVIAVEMHFLPTVYVSCDVCRGKRFERETLEVKYKKKSIYDVLEMTVEEAFLFFKDIPAIHDRLKTLLDVGLGYLKLGQSATTLSGGEAQRIKISSELFRPDLYKTIYLLDEPTVGLHYEDVNKLIEILQRLVDRGNTVIAIEHNMDFIKCADRIIDVGPEGGSGGGEIVAQGTPEEVARHPKSHTAKYLRRVLRKK